MTETQIMDKVHKMYREQFEKEHPDLDNNIDTDYIEELLNEAETLSEGV